MDPNDPNMASFDLSWSFDVKKCMGAPNLTPDYTSAPDLNNKTPLNFGFYDEVLWVSADVLRVRGPNILVWKV